MKKKIKMLMISSATGGHAIPIKVLAEAFYKSHDFDVRIIHSGSTIERQLFTGLKCRVLLSGKFHRHEQWKNIWQSIKFIYAMIKSFFILIIDRPAVVFSKGGFNSYPVLFWTKLLRIPYYIHETDSVMGLANRAFYKRAEKAFVSFPVSCYNLSAEKLCYSGMIVRDFPAEPKKPHQKPWILVIGGSQGSAVINKTIMGALPDLLQNNEVFLAVGTNGSLDLSESNFNLLPEALKNRFHNFPFSLKKIEELLPQSDVIISRAGGTIGEIAKLKKASILIPYPYAAADHQLKNARYLEKKGGAIVIKEDNFSKESLLNRIKFILTNNNAQIIGEHAEKTIKTDGEDVILSTISKYFGV